MAIYVLVHGGDISTDTWNELSKRNDYPSGGHLGGKIWDNIESKLKAEGHIVFAPTLKDKHSSNLSDHIKQLCNLITEHNLKDIILVGHSYGGMIITGVADKMADRIGLLVYLDAALPNPGESLFDLLRLGGLDPETIEEGSPMPYVEKLQFDPKIIRALQKIYIFCTESSFITVTNIAKKKIAADTQGWSCFELPTSHAPQATMPEKLSNLLLEFGKS